MAAIPINHTFHPLQHKRQLKFYQPCAHKSVHLTSLWHTSPPTQGHHHINHINIAQLILGVHPASHIAAGAAAPNSQPQPCAGAGAPAVIARSGNSCPGTRGSGIAASVGPTEKPSFSLIDRRPLAGGELESVEWRQGRLLRVWTPPGYSRADADAEPYPVVYLNDGQNLYDDKLSLSGHSWRAAEAAAGLIGSGRLPPFVMVGIDHAGPLRSYDYLPYPPGDAGGFRLDATRWPGGGLDAFMAALKEEILPYCERSYGVSSDPALRVFGGSSFGGMAALCGGLRMAGVFSGLLVESPSLWAGCEDALRRELPEHSGPWPERVFLAIGTMEYSGVRPEPEPAFDAHLVALTQQCAALLEAAGLTRGTRLALVIDEGAAHNEAAWASRLPTALAHLGAGWPQRTTEATSHPDAAA